MLTRTDNILTTNKLVKLMMLWTTGPRLLHFILLYYIQLCSVIYEGESKSNQPNLFPVEIHLFFFDVIALQCDAHRPTVFKCHQPRTEKVRVLSIDPLLNCHHDIPDSLYRFHCNFASVDSCIVLLQQNTFREFTRWRFSAGLTSLHSTLQLLYFSWVKSPT